MFTMTKVKQVVVQVSRPVPGQGSPPKPRFWLETIALVSAIACALALMIAALGMAAGSAAAEPLTNQSQPSSEIPVQSYEGIVTDTQCGARHSAALGKTATDCTLACVHGGGQFALVAGDATYLIEGDLAMLKRAAGQRVRVMGTLNGRKISVRSVAGD
jgi:hypothetical protein